MSRYLPKLLLFAAAGLVVRLVYGFSLDEPSGDAVFYHQVANALADGDGFVNPTLGTATAGHPPLFPAALAVVSLFGGTSETAHQAAGCVLGAATAIPVGFAGRRLAGPTTGLIAAGAVAFYLPMIANDSLLYSESLYGLTIALALLAALRLRERPDPLRSLVLGAAIGAAALVRTEALLLLVLMGIPLARAIGWRGLALVCAGAAALVLPWTARNLSVFDRFVLVSTNDGSVIGGANCDTTYGSLLGQWDLLCAVRAGADPNRPRELRALEAALRRGADQEEVGTVLLRAVGRNEAVVAARQRRVGFRFARHHAGELPKVVAARVGRTWSVYRVREQVRTNGFLRGSPAWLEWLTVASFAVAALLAAAGGVILRRRGGPLALLLAPVLLVTIASALGYGTPRFRQAAEVSIVLLASVAAARALEGVATVAPSE